MSLKIARAAVVAAADPSQAAVDAVQDGLPRGAALDVSQCSSVLAALETNSEKT
jgi:hypothetical protein